MKFYITLNVPTKNGMSHQVIGEHKSQSIEEFKSALHQEDFIIVEEWQTGNNGKIVNAGKLLLNHQLIGKVREYEPK